MSSSSVNTAVASVKDSISERKTPPKVSPVWQARVENMVQKVPFGYLTSYKDVAVALGAPKHSRHVGFAMKTCNESKTPWWRCVNSAGCITISADEDAERQKIKLKAEGHIFKNRKIVTFEKNRYCFTEAGSEASLSNQNSKANESENKTAHTKIKNIESVNSVVIAKKRQAKDTNDLSANDCNIKIDKIIISTSIKRTKK